MIATILIIVLITPSGGESRTEQEFKSRSECRTAHALAILAMRTDPKGYTLVSADCERVK
jgi:hypothetical protein